MDVLWTKDKYHKIFSTANLVFHASGDGATAGRCCRLCGGDNSLKSFADKYQLEGVEGMEGQYDQLLYECFRVRVSPPDSLICDWCVRQLRSTGRFRALVYAAFGKATNSITPSQDDSVKSYNTNPEENAGTITYKEMVNLLNTKTGSEKSKKKVAESLNSTGKRKNVQCAICKQKYLCIIQSGDGEFVCSRCKKNGAKKSVCKKCNVAMPYRMMPDHMELHAKAELRRKKSLPMPIKPSQTKHDALKNRTVPKYKCPVCPKRYMTAQHLAEHIKCMHGNGNKSFCEICGKDVKNNETFEKHIQIHVEQVANFQCPPQIYKDETVFENAPNCAGKKRCLTFDRPPFFLE